MTMDEGWNEDQLLNGKHRFATHLCLQPTGDPHNCNFCTNLLVHLLLCLPITPEKDSAILQLIHDNQ